MVNPIVGTDADDVLLGTPQGDVIQGERGDDFLYGGDGDDVISDGSGVDVLYGGDGDDRFQLTDNNAFDDASLLFDPTRSFPLNGGAGTDTLDATDATEGLAIASLIFAYASIEVVQGSQFDDIVYADGATFAVTLSGGDGNDILISGSGDDVLRGEAGADTLEAGAGTNLLTGGEGSDRFSFRPWEQTNDTVTDVNFAAGDTLSFYQFFTDDWQTFDNLPDLLTASVKQGFTFSTDHAGLVIRLAPTQTLTLQFETAPDSPDIPPENSEDLESADTPESLDSTENAETPESPETAADPESSEVSETLESPSGPENSQSLESLDSSEDLESAAEAEQSESLESAANFKNPENSESLESPETSDDSENPECPAEAENLDDFNNTAPPENVQNSDTPESLDNSDTPEFSGSETLEPPEHPAELESSENQENASVERSETTVAVFSLRTSTESAADPTEVEQLETPPASAPETVDTTDRSLQETPPSVDPDDSAVTSEEPETAIAASEIAPEETTSSSHATEPCTVEEASASPLRQDDLLLGSEGDDYLASNLGHDVLLGGPGSDTFDITHLGDGDTHWILDFEQGRDTLVLSDSTLLAGATTAPVLSDIETAQAYAATVPGVTVTSLQAIYGSQASAGFRMAVSPSGMTSPTRWITVVYAQDPAAVSADESVVAPPASETSVLFPIV